MYVCMYVHKRWSRDFAMCGHMSLASKSSATASVAPSQETAKADCRSVPLKPLGFNSGVFKKRGYLGEPIGKY